LISEEESLSGFAGFADFRGISTIPLGEHRFVAAVVVSVLLHAFVLLTLMAHADFRAPEDFLQMSLPVIDVSLISEPHGSAQMRPPLSRGKKGERSGSSTAETKKAVPVSRSFSKEEKKMPETPSSSPALPAGEKITAKPPVVSAALLENTFAKKLETPASESNAISLDSNALPAAGSTDLSRGKSGSTGKTGSGLWSNSGGNASHGHNSSVASGTRGAGVSGVGNGGNFFSENSAAIPRYRDNAPPLYPPSARRRGYQGRVVLIVEVMADGRPGEVRIGNSSGYPMLDNAAQKAARRWRFEPGRKNGKPVRMLAEVPVRFVLNE
jgi:protein TonB